MQLAKILAAAAWADGVVSPEESAAIEQLGVDLGLNEEDRFVLRAHLAEPVGFDEAVTITRDLLGGLSREERKRWLSRIEAVIASDRTVHPMESRLLETVRVALDEEERPDTFLGRIRGLFKKEREARPVGRDFREGEYAHLFGAILYRVAYADGVITEEEAARLQTILAGQFGFEDEESARIVEAVQGGSAEDLDRQRLCASFNRISDMKERMRLLGCLFTLAEANGSLGETELRELRLISNYLWIGARDFHQVRRDQT